MTDIQFTSNFTGWKNTQSIEDATRASPGEIALLIAKSMEGIDSLVGHSLQKLNDFSGIQKIMADTPPAGGLSYLNTRKITQAINAYVPEKLQKKEKNEIAGFVRLYLVRSLLAKRGVYLNYGKSTGSVSYKEGDALQFLANYSDWKSVKKMTVTEVTNPRTVMEFSGSFCASLENKLESFLQKSIDLKKLDGLVNNAPAGKTSNDLDAMEEYLASPELPKKISELVLDKKLAELCQIYVNRMVVEPRKLSALYAQIDIPGLKRLLKKKK